MKKKLTVCVGIPAYNEEKNIIFLLKDILKQKLISAEIRQIIIFSDGSTDNAILEVKKIKNKKIMIIENKKREGQAKAQNKIIKNTDADILVILNADIRFPSIYTLERLISPIVLKKADLVAAGITGVKATAFFEKILLISMKIKNHAYREFNKGNNVYTCFGQARAFSKNLYKKIYFPSSIGEDAYSYFYCIANRFRYQYLPDVRILYKLPTSFSDHQRQSIRFFQSQKLLEKTFDEKFVKSEYAIPQKLLIKGVLRVFVRFPHYTMLYLGMLIYLKFKSLFDSRIKDTWEISKSSKKLTI